jgi:hypothetical protein
VSVTLALLVLALVVVVALGAMVFGVVRAATTPDPNRRRRAVIGVVGLAVILLVVGVGVALVIRAASG